MRKLFYATFEKGYDEIVKKFIKKQDKNSHIKRLFSDGVLFFASENFKFANSLFIENYHVFDEAKYEGMGAVNAYMTHLLQRKNFKISLPANVKKIKVTIIKYSDKFLVDQKLKGALDIMLAKATKKQVGFMGANGELLLIFKPDGTCMLTLDETKPCEISKLENAFGISARTAFALNFLSDPVEKEVSLDPFSENGYISYIRALCFKKANVIAGERDESKVPAIKKLAKSLKDRAFSVLNYDFNSEIFPIKFIDKIVTCLPRDKSLICAFLNKAYVLKVKKIVLMVSSISIEGMVRGKFDIESTYTVGKNSIYVLNYKK